MAKKNVKSASRIAPAVFADKAKLAALVTSKPSANKPVTTGSELLNRDIAREKFAQDASVLLTQIERKTGEINSARALLLQTAVAAFRAGIFDLIATTTINGKQVNEFCKNVLSPILGESWEKMNGTRKGALRDVVLPLHFAAKKDALGSVEAADGSALTFKANGAIVVRNAVLPDGLKSKGGEATRDMSFLDIKRAANAIVGTVTVKQDRAKRREVALDALITFYKAENTDIEDVSHVEWNKIGMLVNRFGQMLSARKAMQDEHTKGRGTDARKTA